MSYPMTQQLGSRAFHHEQNPQIEEEYERLRDSARKERDKKSSCMAKSHQAYERGDGQGAHELSEEGNRHGAMADQYNKQASDYIFRENNAVGRVDGDTIDLHGQFVEEAEDILEARIRYAQQQGQTHLHVIVGKGIHSVNHVQKIKPRVEQICRELGLQFATEENAGRIYVNLQGGAAVMPNYSSSPQGQGGYVGGQQQHHGKPHHGQGQHQQGYQQQQQGGYQQGYQQQQPQQQQQQQQYQGGYQQQGQHGNNNNNQNAEIEAAVKKYLPRLMRKLGCCTVM